jgi:hypothetical protein
MKTYWTTPSNAAEVDLNKDGFFYERVCRFDCASGYRRRFN